MLCKKLHCVESVYTGLVSMGFSAKEEAFVVVFAALYYVFSLVSPFVPAVGLPEIKIHLEAFLASVFGILLGARLGALTALVGALVAWILPPGNASVYGAPFLLSPPLNAFVSGLVYERRWKEAVGVMAFLIGVFWFTLPVTPFSQYWYVGLAVTFDKIIALALIVPAAVLLNRRRGLFVAFFLLAFVGNQTDNMWGALVFAFPVVYSGVFGLNVEVVRFLFTVSPFVYPAIRLVQALLAAVVAVPLVRALRGAGWLPLGRKHEG
ncbi:MAG: hypothetical protein ACUVT5_04285 [Candidatus Bathyarchaeales archaeon]